MSGPLYRGSANWSAEANRLRTAGIGMPVNPTMARAEAQNISIAAHNKSLTAQMNRQRLASYRGGGGGMQRTAANLQIALPKIREPLGTLQDKGIPFNVENREELIGIRRWCRMFYTTHDLVPLLIDIYSKFPCVGLEFESKDPMIKRFYEDMFLGPELNYLEWLPDQFGREYFTVGEVTSLGHFNESLAIWSSEEILNPDQLRVSRAMFVQRERVQLLVKDLVDNLRQGPMAEGSQLSTTEETPSERLQRTEEYQQLAAEYPEIIQAAAQNDGLDISEALLSRVVNRTTPWANYGTPHLLRSFRTLMMEESLNAAQDAVSDRLYSPLILATLGVPDLGDGEPWIPSQDELDDTRDDMQTALAADFRLMVHNFGLKIESVFGRESVPNLDADYQRIDQKLLQAWGIGEALISGGSGGPYASSALNREFVTQMMVGFQNSLRRHIIKRAEVIAEAQGHYDYELKGGRRVPVYRDIVVDEGTEDERIERVPKLLIPDVKFSTLNLRDEAQERAFVAQLKSMGVPVSDRKLAINIDMEFQAELEIQADESVAKLVATAQAMKKAQDLCDAQNLPYPPELAQHLMSTLQLRQGKDQTDQLDAQTPVVELQSELQEEQLGMQKAMLDQQIAQMMGMGGPPALPPGQGGGPPPEGGGAPEGGAPGGAAEETQGSGGPAAEAPSASMGSQVGGPGVPAPGVPGPGGAPAGRYGGKKAFLNVNAPTGAPPAAKGPSGGVGPEPPPGQKEPGQVIEPPRNRARPEISDEQRKTMPKTTRRKRTRKGEENVVEMPRKKSRFETGPSSYGHSRKITEEEVQNQVMRREAIWRHIPARHPQVADLVNDPTFYRAMNSQTYRGQIQADWPEILAGGAHDSKKLLDAMLEQYYQVFGVEPTW